MAWLALVPVTSLNAVARIAHGPERNWLVPRGLAVLAVYLILVCGCGASRQRGDAGLPPAVESTNLGAGDVLEIRIVGETELPEEYQVASDGTLDIPYIHRVSVAGLEPQQVQALIRRRFISDGILTDPSVVVRVKEYNSKRVTLLGQVQRPGKFPLTTGMTLLEALSMSGGFTPLARSDAVRITRKTPSKTHTVVVDVDAIMGGVHRDIPLQAGDSIYVGERIF